MDVGCVEVANDDCLYPYMGFTDDFQNITNILRNDPTLAQIGSLSKVIFMDIYPGWETYIDLSSVGWWKGLLQKHFKSECSFQHHFGEKFTSS